MIKKLKLADVQVFSYENTARAEAEEILKWCDVVVSQSPAGVGSVALALKYQEMGKVVISDYDDLVYSCSPFNPAYKTLGIKSVKVKDVNGVEQDLWVDGTFGFSIKDNLLRKKAQEDIFKVSDGVTTTTDFLKNRFIEENPCLADKIGVIPNSIDFNLFKPFPKRDSDRIRIGWIASSSHLNEIWIVRNVMRRIFNKYGNQVVFVQQGDIVELKKVFTPQEMEFHNFIDLSIYPLKIASLNLDIGICPLFDDEFNSHKSQLKWSEYSSLRVPSVCSDLPPYACVEEGVTGYKAKDEDEFVEKLCKLIDDKKLRTEIGQNAYNKNLEDFNLEKVAHKWVEFYENIYSRIG